MEVPEEYERRWVAAYGHGARVAAEALKVQLQGMADILDVVERLRHAGHPHYQDDWELR